MVIVLLLVDGGMAQASALGTREQPIYMLLVAGTQGTAVEAVGRAIAEGLFELTGLYIVPALQWDDASMIEAFAASKGDTFAFPTAGQYITIYERTGGNVTPRLGAVRYGYPWYYSSIYARRDSGIKTLEDLNGKVWIYNDPGSTSGYVLPRDLFFAEGIQVGSVMETGGHTNSMVALIEGQGDFCTGYGSPPIPPSEGLAAGSKWKWGMPAEIWIWDSVGNDLYDQDSRSTCTDLRRAVDRIYNLDTVLREIGVVANIGPIPNDCLCFGPGFPEEIADSIVEAVQTHIATDEGQALWADPDFYGWTEVTPIGDSWYDGYRSLLGLAIPSDRSAVGYYLESEVTRAAQETIEMVEDILEVADGVIDNLKANVGAVAELSKELAALAERGDLPRTIPELEEVLESINLLEEELESATPTDFLEAISDLESKLKEMRDLEVELTPGALVEVEEALAEIGEFKAELITAIGELEAVKETTGRLREDVYEAIDELEEEPEQIDTVEEELPALEDSTREEACASLPSIVMVVWRLSPAIEAIAEALSSALGIPITPVWGESRDELPDLFVAPDHLAFGFLYADEYLEVYDQAEGDVVPRLVTVRYGSPYYYSSVYAHRDQAIDSWDDLQGLTWCYNDPWSTSGYKFPAAAFELLGLQFRDTVETGAHTISMVALIEGECDFCTSYGSPPVAPNGSPAIWRWGDTPEKWLWDSSTGEIVPQAERGTCTDLRNAVADLYGEDWVLENIAVVANIGRIPNETLTFGPGFPSEVADRIVEEIEAQMGTEEGRALWGSPEAFAVLEPVPTSDAAFDCYREIMDVTGSGTISSTCAYFGDSITSTAEVAEGQAAPEPCGLLRMAWLGLGSEGESIDTVERWLHLPLVIFLSNSCSEAVEVLSVEITSLDGQIVEPIWQSAESPVVVGAGEEVRWYWKSPGLLLDGEYVLLVTLSVGELELRFKVTD